METPIKTLREIENEHLLLVLEHCSWNQSRAAKILGICYRTLRFKVAALRDAGVSVPSASKNAHDFRADKGRGRKVTALFCDYCHANFERETTLVNQQRKTGQKLFFCCPEHFGNFKYERGQGKSA